MRKYITRYFTVRGGFQVFMAPGYQEILANRLQQSVYDFAQNAYYDTFFDSRASKETHHFDDVLEEMLADGRLIKSRKDIAESILTHNFSLLQGPAGSGKTLLLAYLAKYFVAADKRVMFCGSSNASSDAICQQLHELGVDFVRVYSQRHHDKLFEGGPSICQEPSVLPYEIHHRTIDEISQMFDDGDLADLNFKEWQNLEDRVGYRRPYKIGQLSQYKKSSDLLAYQVYQHVFSRMLIDAQVIVTNSNNISDNRFMDLDFDALFIDDASALTVPAALHAMSLKPKLVVFSSDMLQHSPNVVKDLRNSDYKRSMFEYLNKQDKINKVRMIDQCCRTDAQVVYAGKKILDFTEEDVPEGVRPVFANELAGFHGYCRQFVDNDLDVFRMQLMIEQTRETLAGCGIEEVCFVVPSAFVRRQLALADAEFSVADIYAPADVVGRTFDCVVLVAVQCKFTQMEYMWPTMVTRHRYAFVLLTSADQHMNPNEVNRLVRWFEAHEAAQRVELIQ